MATRCSIAELARAGAEAIMQAATSTSDRMHRPSIFSRLRRTCAVRFLAAAAASAALSGAAGAEDIVWDFGTAAPGSALPSSAAVANLEASPISKGNNNGTTPLLTTSSNSGSTYPGASAFYNAGAAARVGAYDAAQSAYFEVSLTPAGGYRVDVTGIEFGTRRTSTGPVNYSIRRSTDLYAQEVAGGATPGIVNTQFPWGLMSNRGLALSSGGRITIRIYGTDGTGSSSASTANWRIDDLKLSVVVVQDGTPEPAISDIEPHSGTVGTAVTVTGTNFGAAPAVRFNGTLAAGSTVNPAGTSISTTVPAGATTGTVTVTAPGGVANSASPFTVVTLPVLTVLISPSIILENAVSPAAVGAVSVDTAPVSDVTVTLGNNAPASASVTASIVITGGTTFASFNVDPVPNPASFIDATATITATAPGYDQGTATVTVQNTDAQPTTVVINKYLNVSSNSGGTGDIIELLVTGDGTPGSTVDMRRMLVKDHSSSMASDGGGKFRFNNITEWSAVKAGTLIVLTHAASTSDTDPADFLLRLGLLDTTYFASEGGTFDIATTEVVMIKGQDAAAAGVSGSIHALAGGAEGPQFSAASPKKLLAAGTTGTGKGVVANNTTLSLADFDGTDATGDLALISADFGFSNNNNNNAFIRTLRGITTLDGSGIATITNGTAGSPFNGKNFFPRNTSGQSVAISLSSNAGPGALTSVKISVPAAFGAPEAGAVTVTGTGGGTPSVSVTGQDITIIGTAITLADAALISIAALSTPNPAAVTDDGRFPFTIASAGDAGVLTAIASSPNALVTIPVANVRDVDANGVPLDFGKVVAIEVVCTEEDFDSALRTSGYGQDGDFGINIFVQGQELNLIRGHRYAITGQIIEYNRLTEISPGSAANVTDLGSGTEPAPLTISVPDLLATPEAFEGRLIKIATLNYSSGTWAPDQIVAVTDPLTNPMDIRIQTGSEATTVPLWPATITGIFGQRDDNAPGPGYHIMPRNDADVESLGGGPGYDGWASLYPGISGPEVDDDGDGVTNLMEYAGGSHPLDGRSLPVSVQAVTGATFTALWVKGPTAAADATLSWSIETSTSMAANTWSTAGVTLNGPTAISGDYDLTSGQAKVFFRLKVVRTP